jgi:pimeloyl-ACP methyl ester carboxylesterase
VVDPQRAPLAPGLVEPFYFGDGALYGCLHPGARDDLGAVICQPFGHEYITFHRAARQLATQVSRAGVPTLRFDYSGCGDSAGGLRQARLADWVHDVGSAVEALRARAAVGRVALVGVRLGASLALLAARERDDLASLVLWDPVIRGRTYLRELGRDARRMRRVAHVTPRDPDAAADSGPEGDLELLGFVLAAPLVADLRGLDLDTITPACAPRTLLLETSPAASAPLGALLRGAGCDVDTRTEALPHAWRWSEDITRVQLPHAQVRTVARWLTGAGA